MNVEHDFKTTRLPVSICPTPLPLLASIWFAECTWIYTVVAALSALPGTGPVFSPVAVLLPFGLATLTTLVLSLLPRFIDTHHSHYPASAARYLMLDTRTAILFTAVQLFEGIVSLLLVVWWELYRAERLLDTGWLQLALADARGSINTISTAVLLVCLGIFLWWRGHYLAREEMEFSSLLTRFLWGSGLLLIMESFGASRPLGLMAPWLLGCYLLSGLSALAMAKRLTVEADRLGLVGMDQIWRWRGSALAMLLVVLGFGFGLLLLPLLGDLADWLWNNVAVPLFLLLLDIVRWIAHLLGLDKPPEQAALPPGEGVRTSSGGQRDLFSLPEWLREIGRWMFNISWISIILYGIYLWVKRWFWDRGTLVSNGASRSKRPWRWHLDLKAALRWIILGLLSHWPALSRWLPWLSETRQQSWTIRQLYRRLLVWGASKGVPRLEWITPWEYQAILSARWPSLAGEFAFLTESYLRARYGGQSLDEGEWELVVSNWQKILDEDHNNSSN